MKPVVVATLGSAGDLHPFLAVARALQESGRAVLFLSAEPHRASVEREGLRFEPILTARQQAELATHPDLWHPLRGFGVLWRYAAIRSVAPTVERLHPLLKTHGTQLTVLCSPLVLGARLLRDRQPFQLMHLHTAPHALRSHAHPLFVAGHLVPRWVPPALRSALWHGLDRWKLEPLGRPFVDRWHRQEGLPTCTGSIFGDWLPTPDDHIGLFPESWATERKPWPFPMHCVGFPLHQARRQEHTPPDDTLLEWWRHDHPGPRIVAYAGSAPTRTRAHVRAAAEYFAHHGAKALLIDSSASIHGSSESTNRLRIVPWVDELAPLLAQSNLWIHHGGIGSIAQGLSVGVRQHVLPSAFDQHDNAWHLAIHQNQEYREITTTKWQTVYQHALQHWPKPELEDQDLRPSRPDAPNHAVRSIVREVERLAK